MNSKKNTYIFKYDKYNNLYNYVEKHSTGNILSFYSYNYKNNSMIRYDKDTKTRVFTQYDESCKLVHRFEAGESWVKSVPINDNSYIYQNPKIKKQFAVNHENKIVRFSVQQYLMIDFK